MNEILQMWKIKHSLTSVWLKRFQLKKIHRQPSYLEIYLNKVKVVILRKKVTDSVFTKRFDNTLLLQLLLQLLQSQQKSFQWTIFQLLQPQFIKLLKTALMLCKSIKITFKYTVQIYRLDCFNMCMLNNYKNNISLTF